MAGRQTGNTASQAERLSDAQMDQQAKAMGQTLADGPKVKIKIPLDPLNKEDSMVPVGINGYFYYIKRGETVEVPETVADILTRAKYI